MLRSFLSVSVVYAIGVPLSLAANIVLARWLSVEQFGLYSFAIALATFIAIPVSGGLPLLLTREVSKSAQTGDTQTLCSAVSTAVLWVILASLVVAAIVIMATARFDPARAAISSLALAMVPAMGLMAMGEGILKGLGRPAVAEASRQLMVAPILLIAVYTLSRIATPAAKDVLVANLLAYALVALSTLVLAILLSPTKLRPSLATKTQIGPWARALLSFALISGVSTLSAQIATLVLGLRGADEQVAYMRIAERGAQLVVFPLMFINAVLGPRIVAAYRKGSRGELHALSRHAARMTLAMAAPVALVLLLFGRPLIILTFGPDYAAGAHLPLVILVTGQVLFVGLGSPNLFLAMTSHEHDNLRSQGVGLVVLVALVLGLTPLFGATGAAIGVAIGMIVSKALAVGFLHRRFAFLSGPF